MTTPTSTEHRDPIQQIRVWYQQHRRTAIAAIIAVVVIGGGVWFYLSAQQRRARFAAAALEDARAAAQAGNFPLAASDLNRLISSYGHTDAADEATILLGQIRLAQNDPTTAAQELRRAIAAGLGDQFRAQAYGLLGSALETLGNAADAGDAYLNAASASWYDYLAAQYLNDAGGSFAAAGDTTRATAAYQRVLDDYKDSPSVGEARIRLAELTAPQKAVKG